MDIQIISIVVYCLLGCLFGLFMGVIPTVGSTKALILLFSIVSLFGSMPYEFVAFSLAVAISCTIGDSFAGVYMGVPGANGSVATIVDGFPLTKKGKSSYAISLAVTTSGLQGLVWITPFILIIPFYLDLIKYLKVPEIWSIIIFSFLSVSLLVGPSASKSLIAIILGIGLGSIGSDVMNNPRFTFGYDDYLYDGIATIVISAGLFSIPEMYTLYKSKISNNLIRANTNYNQIFQGIIDAVKLWRQSFIGGAIGFFYGLLPGYGGNPAEWISYSISSKLKRKFKTPFGEGAPEGIVAPEGVNNASKAGALLPTILLGIPGATWAMVITGLWEYKGFEIGDASIIDDTLFINAIIISYILSIIITVLLSLILAKQLTTLLMINKNVVIIAITVLTWWATISTNYYLFILEDTIALIVFSLLGFTCKVHKISRPAILLGFILSNKVEMYTYQLIDLYQFNQIITRPFVIGVIMLSIIMVYYRKKFRIDYV